MKILRAFSYIIGVIFLGVFLMPAPPATAQDAENSTAKILPIAMENFPPFEYKENGKIIGFDTETVQEVLARLGYAPDIHVLPWARAQEYTKRGKMAAIYSLTKNPEREEYYYFSDPISTVKDVFFKLKKNPIAWKSLDDLKDYKIGVSHGYSYAPEFMKAMETGLLGNIDVLSGSSPELRQLNKIKKGHIDLCICEISVCQFLIASNAPGLNMIDFIDQPIGHIRSYHIAFSKKWPNAEIIVRAFNAELAKFIAEGKQEAIFNKYKASPPEADASQKEDGKKVQ